MSIFVWLRDGSIAVKTADQKGGQCLQREATHHGVVKEEGLLLCGWEASSRVTRCVVSTLPGTQKQGWRGGLGAGWGRVRSSLRVQGGEGRARWKGQPGGR